MATKLIKNGAIITATDHYVGDVYIDGEVVTMIGTDIDLPADETIDAVGKFVIPGGVDVHTHLAASADDFERGTIAAACGGTTSVVDCAIPERGHSLRHAWERSMGNAEGKAAIDYGFHIAMREFNDESGNEMESMVTEGVTSFQLAMAGDRRLNDGDMFRAMQRSGEIGALICVHAENGLLIDVLVEQALAAGNTGPEVQAIGRPARAEAEATHRAIAMAEIAGVPVQIVAVSAAEALEHVRTARDRGVPAYAGTCPQSLLETSDDRWKGLKYDDLQLVTSDHGPLAKRGNGAADIETRVPLVYDGGVRTGRLSLNRWVEVCSTAPAKIFGLFPKKGTIAPGSDADIVVFDPDKKVTIRPETLHMNADHDPCEGREVVGWTETALSRGNVVVSGGEFVGNVGAGRYLRRSPRSPDL